MEKKENSSILLERVGDFLNRIKESNAELEKNEKSNSNDQRIDTFLEPLVKSDTVQNDDSDISCNSIGCKVKKDSVKEINDSGVKRKRSRGVDEQDTDRQIELTFALGDFDQSEIARLEGESNNIQPDGVLPTVEGRNEVEKAVIKKLKTKVKDVNIESRIGPKSSIHGENYLDETLDKREQTKVNPLITECIGSLDSSRGL